MHVKARRQRPDLGDDGWQPVAPTNQARRNANPIEPRSEKAGFGQAVASTGNQERVGVVGLVDGVEQLAHLVEGHDGFVSPERVPPQSGRRRL
jgi:hypothetical protein